MGRTTTWADFDHRVTKLAGALHWRGVRQGDRVMILMLNRPEFVEATLAANRIGAIAVPVNFRLTRPSWRSWWRTAGRRAGHQAGAGRRRHRGA